MHLQFHPAPGLGDMVPGFTYLPYNPVTGSREYRGGRTHIGYLMPGKFAEPENPVMRAVTSGICGNGMTGCGIRGLPTRDAWREMGPSAGFENQYDPTLDGWGRGMAGLGFLGLPGDTSTWLFAGAGVLVLMLLMSRKGKSEYRSALDSAKQSYRASVQKIRQQYPRYAGRIRRAAAAAKEAF
jgi:hypothetical protein